MTFYYTLFMMMIFNVAWNIGERARSRMNHFQSYKVGREGEEYQTFAVSPFPVTALCYIL